jgi:hypothetical protein
VLPWLSNGPSPSQNQDLYQFLNNFIVKPVHSRSKNGVASLAYVAGIHALKA